MEPENAHLEKDNYLNHTFIFVGSIWNLKGLTAGTQSRGYLVQMIFLFEQGMFEFYLNFSGVYFFNANILVAQELLIFNAAHFWENLSCCKCMVILRKVHLSIVHCLAW